MSELGEIRIVCDRGALHPKHPVSMVTGYIPSARGGWMLAPMHAPTLGRLANGAVLRDNVPVIIDEVPSGVSDGTDFTVLDGTREVYQLECRLCHRDSVDVREDKLWKILDLLQHAGRDKVTLAELHSILKTLAQRVPDGREQTAPTE